MPGIILKLSGEPNLDLVRRIVPQITALTCAVLEKRPEQTLVMLQFVPHDHWFIDNRSLIEHGRNSFRLEVTITDETNTKVQKARYHREVFALLSDLIGNLHQHSSVHLVDCRAATYGYGGLTQEFRHQRA
ncbi:4-oxalocrotonate tautomerase family protein [uncultured Methylobacterium sp.]|uniref:tautomerase family protein n=1 Tax=uncultured Methylobacterium sp. TaxID=157278 RepID=UPI0035CAFAC3